MSSVFWDFFSTPMLFADCVCSPESQPFSRPQTSIARLENFPQCPILPYYAIFLLYTTFIAVSSVCHMPCLKLCLTQIMFWCLSILHNSVWQRRHVNCLMNEWGTHNSQVPWNKTEWTALHHRWPPSLLFTYNSSPILPCHQKQLSYVYWKENKLRAGVIAHFFKALVRQARGPDFKSTEPP